MTSESRSAAQQMLGGFADKLAFHLHLGKANGLTESEIVEAITHLAFYAGWSRAMPAITAARATFAGKR